MTDSAAQLLNSSTNNLFFVEHDYQVEDFLKRGFKGKGEWIALGPSAMWILEQNNIKYKLPEEFYEQDQLEIICQNTHKDVESLCNKLDDLFIEKCPEFKRFKIKPFLFNIFPLTVLFDGLISRIFQLMSILQCYPDYHIWVHISPPHAWGIFDLSFSNNETLYGKLLSLNGWVNKINLIDIKSVNLNGKDSLLKSIVKKSIFVSSCLYYIKKKNLKGLKSVFSGNKKGTILIGSLKEWEHIIPLLIDKGINVKLYFNSYVKRRNYKSDNIFYENYKDYINHYFQYKGVNIYPLLQDRFEWLFRNYCKNGKRIIKKTIKLLNKYNIKMMLTSTSSVFSEHVHKQSLRANKVPVINWQHGFVVYNKGISQLNEFNDMMTSDIVITYGESVSEGYKHYLSKLPADIVSVGSINLDKIQEEYKIYSVRNNIKSDSGFKILYATTNYLQNTWYFGFAPPYSDRYMYMDQIAIMNFLSHVAENKLGNITVKLHPILSHPDPPWIDKYRSDTIKIVKFTPNYIDLLKSHDIILLDLPSTTLLESLATFKPVFVLLRHWQYPYEAREMLRRRAVCADECNQLLNLMHVYLTTGVYPADIYDDSFIKAYGIYSDDGKAAERALKIIENNIEIDL